LASLPSVLLHLRSRNLALAVLPAVALVALAVVAAVQAVALVVVVAAVRLRLPSRWPTSRRRSPP